ncbi:DUF4124 domain-containing protein [Pseudomonas oryzae]|uniref:Uncharacterized protein n=1 Tax=Pseudomonas oryzae TaxID=1392877 RepID=A0A1H1XCM0_9PSED|nr:DUF4124 domain-containing protein [Pseudomonas oryzae]SDT07027.1 protein of unknown function [Pseudomonas oryzae]
MRMVNGVWLLLAGLLAMSTAQAEVYRYVNRQGVVALDRQGVPPEYVANGYEVLDEEGRVLRVVPPAPSAEELARRAAAQRQAAFDADLLQRYASAADLEWAQVRRLRDLDALARIAQSNLEASRLRLQETERQAAERQRAGQALAPELLAQREQLQREEQRLLAELKRVQAQRASSEVEFARERERLQVLLGEPRRTP